MQDKDKLIIDLDDTITIDSSDKEYGKKAPNKKIRDTINRLHKKSFPITIFSARNMRSLDGDLEKINKITKPIAEKWLKDNEIYYNELIFGKPWAGPGGWYVDDKNLSLEEFIFKFSGPFADKSFDVVVTCFNEGKNIGKTFESIKRLERLININSYILINNGSNDETKEVITSLEKTEKKVRLIDLKSNEGYGGGLKQGLKECSSEYALINHADGQFDAYSFIFSNMDSFEGNFDAVMPRRLNRSLTSNLLSMILRFVLCAIKLQKIPDFNGQPKILNITKLKNISELPNDFSIDYCLFKIYEGRTIELPVIEKKRKEGESSWKSHLFNWFFIFYRYIVIAISFKQEKFRR